MLREHLTELISSTLILLSAPCLASNVVHVLTLPWLPTQEVGHIPEDSNQDTVHKDVMSAPPRV